MEWKGKNMIWRTSKLTGLQFHTGLKKFDKIVIVENKPEKKKERKKMRADRSHVLSCEFLSTKIISHVGCVALVNKFIISVIESFLKCAGQMETLHICLINTTLSLIDLFPSSSRGRTPLKSWKSSKVSRWVLQEK